MDQRHRLAAWTATCALGAAALSALILPAVSSASPRTRSCGNTPSPGLTILVHATPNVRCGRALQIMKGVYGENGSTQCNSFASVHTCYFDGFYCVIRQTPGTDISSARCTKPRNKLINGHT